MMDPEDHLTLEGQLSGQYPVYVLLAEANYTGVAPLPKAQLSIQLDRPYLKIHAVHGKGNTHTDTFIILIYNFILFEYYTRVLERMSSLVYTRSFSSLKIINIESLVVNGKCNQTANRKAHVLN
jgi:hypothetical protein